MSPTGLELVLPTYREGKLLAASRVAMVVAAVGLQRLPARRVQGEPRRVSSMPAEPLARSGVLDQCPSSTHAN